MTLHNVLYILPDGRPKASASYSARSKFKHCKRLFQLTYVQGYKSKREGAAWRFGNVVEAAVAHHTQNAGKGGPDKFLALWEEAKLDPKFLKWEYTKVEESWENMRRIGHEWLQLFAIRFKSLPLQDAQFQVPLRKKIFAGTSYDAITNLAYLDILSYPPANHPMLVRPDFNEVFVFNRRPLIIDVKTASKELAERLTVLDPQLIEYAWMRNSRDVAFLWFAKKSHGYKFASRVTLLQDFESLKAGAELLVIEKADGDFVWVGDQGSISLYDNLFTGADGKTITGNRAKAISQEFFALGSATLVPANILTKQILQFAAARIGQQELDDMGKVVGQTTVEMVVAHETDFYPQEPGIRFPSEKCNMCDMRFICTGDGDGRDRFLTRVGEEWLDTTVEE